MRLKIAHCDTIANKQQAQAAADNLMEISVPPSTPPNVRRLFTESQTPTQGRFEALTTLTKDSSDISTEKDFE